jgi:hypothetical protein
VCVRLFPIRTEPDEIGKRNRLRQVFYGLADIVLHTLVDILAPSRVSSWEIHPVYAIDVCKKKSLNSCKADNDSVWTPLDQWQGDE